jgi:hypothetical protein
MNSGIGIDELFNQPRTSYPIDRCLFMTCLMQSPLGRCRRLQEYRIVAPGPARLLRRRRLSLSRAKGAYSESCTKNRRGRAACAIRA